MIERTGKILGFAGTASQFSSHCVTRDCGLVSKKRHGKGFLMRFILEETVDVIMTEELEPRSFLDPNLQCLLSTGLKFFIPVGPPSETYCPPLIYSITRVTDEDEANVKITIRGMCMSDRDTRLIQVQVETLTDIDDGDLFVVYRLKPATEDEIEYVSEFASPM